MIKRLYKNYFQKSYTFLYPLLGIRNKNSEMKPCHTYMVGDNIKNQSLICVYKLNKENWSKVKNNILLKHPYLENILDISNDTKIAIFDLSSLGDDYNRVLEGEYSKLSPQSKRLILDYYSIQSSTFVYIESFLFPKKYFTIYSELLNVEIDVLEQVGELCDAPNMFKEICPYTISEEAIQYGKFITP